jgi:hypothetical protein
VPITPSAVPSATAPQTSNTDLIAPIVGYGVILIGGYNTTLGDFQYGNDETKTWTITCAGTGNVIVEGVNGSASDTDTLTVRNVDTGVEQSFNGVHINSSTTVAPSVTAVVLWTSNAAGTDRGYAVAYSCFIGGAAQVSLTVAAGTLTMLLALLL